MKAFEKITAALCAVTLCLSLGSAAYATAEDGETQPAAAAVEAPVPASEESEAVSAGSYAGMAWDEIMDALLEKYGASPATVHAGYLNLITGEEHYLNGDSYMVTGSMYKLPLCMYYTELIENGEFNWDTYINYSSYREFQDEVLIHSNNEQAILLWEMLGGYNRFRELTADYMGCPKEELTLEVLVNNMYTAHQFINCLKLLYNEPERFPDIVHTMLQAEPERFFRLSEDRFNIAHKYGYYNNGEGNANMNDCGIVFTSEPIAIVMFTQNLMNSEALLTEYCTAMCDYTEYLAGEPAPLSVTAVQTESAEPAVPSAQEESAPLPLAALICIALFLIAGTIAVISLGRKYGVKIFWLLVSVILSAFIMLLAAVGVRVGTVYAMPDGDPAETAGVFLDALVSGDYPTAYAQLSDYADLGLENPPATEAGRKAYEALRRSYSYELTGECTTDKLNAFQPLRFLYLDLTSIEEAVSQETAVQLKKIVQQRSVSEVYDENRNYRPEIADEAYLAALDAVLADAGKYYGSVELVLSLTYSDGSWHVLTSPALLKALNGGTAY